jgi:hypothetical protein
MHSPIVPNGKPGINRGVPPPDGPAKEAILRELESILTSPFFRTSNRSRQFLSYVVQHTLDGNQEPLKERTIGAKLFQRPVGYATGDDPVVRVQAGEVRRRLEQYHHAGPNDSPVRIELPVGSYAPEFRWAPHPSEPAPLETARTEPAEATGEEAILAVQPAQQTTDGVGKKTGRLTAGRLVVGAGLILILALLAGVVYRTSAPKSTLDRFWAPVLSTQEPVLICLAKPRVYRPSAELYQRYANPPGKFNGEWARLTEPPPLQPNTKLTWGDMVEYTDYGVAAGDVYAALRMSAALNRMGKVSQVRIGNGYSFEDLRSSPAIVVGAFNNRWTMQMTSNLHFAFVEENGQQLIREQGTPGRTWVARYGPHGEAIEDFGIVTRLLNSKTGKFVVATAGLLSEGTQAAAEFVSSSASLEEALKAAPPDWPKKNLQVVVQTTVTDTIPGPPQVIAVYTW